MDHEEFKSAALVAMYAWSEAGGRKRPSGRKRALERDRVFGIKKSSFICFEDDRD